MACSMRNAVVTGANRGLGLEICRQLLSSAARGGATSSYDHVYALCRKSSPELDSLRDNNAEKVSIVQDIDMVNGGYESILTKAMTADDGTAAPVALLVHNAGAYGPPKESSDPSQVYSTQSLDNITAEDLSYAFQLNSVAPLLLTKLLLPNLRANKSSEAEGNSHVAKVIIISSLMGSMTDNTSGGHYAYRASKAAVNMIGKSLATDLSKDGIAVALVHPGFVHTGFGTGPGQEKRPGQRNVDESVQGVLQAVEQVNMVTTGRFWHGNYGEGVKELDW